MSMCLLARMPDTADMSDSAADAPARRSWRQVTPVLLVRAARPRQTLLTAVAFALAAGLADRPAREVALVAGTVVVGQAVLAWDNDLVDERTDRADERTDKALLSGLDRGTLGFALACAVLLVVPLALSNGIVAGLCYLLSLLVGLVGNRFLRRGPLSWLPWAVSFALYPAFLSYGGWGGGTEGGPPTVAMTVAAALLGVGVHVLVSLPGLVRDHEAGRRHLPLRLALVVGAPRLLALTLVYCAVVLGLIVAVAGTVGLRR
jgi:4-hydroxybenzoate polyprenyltransferase